MACTSRLFDGLAADLRHRLTRPPAVRAAARWGLLDPVFTGCADAAEVVDRLTDPGRATTCRRRDLAVMVAWAGDDPVAVDVVFAACLDGLRAVAGQLSRVWGADPGEVDQAVSVAGWARVTREAGRRLEWPDRVIVSGARTAVRDELRAAALYRRRLTPVSDVDSPAFGDRSGSAEDTAMADAAELIIDAVRRGVLSDRSARLVWATRVLGVPATEVAARWAQAPGAVVMRRLRAERALRFDLAARSDEREAS